MADAFDDVCGCYVARVVLGGEEGRGVTRALTDAEPVQDNGPVEAASGMIEVSSLRRAEVMESSLFRPKLPLRVEHE